MFLIFTQSFQNYCRNLCLMAKLFLSSKTLFHEVDTFTFYILTEITPHGCVMLGYFSKACIFTNKRTLNLKEINPSKNNNLSCLLTLPNTQARGYGKLLIDLSEFLVIVNGIFISSSQAINSPNWNTKLGHPNIRSPTWDFKRTAAIGEQFFSLPFAIAATIRQYRSEVLILIEYFKCSFPDLSIATAIHSLDIVSTLLVNQMLSFRHDTYYIDIVGILL